MITYENYTISFTDNTEGENGIRITNTDTRAEYGILRLSQSAIQSSDKKVFDMLEIYEIVDLLKAEFLQKDPKISMTETVKTLHLKYKLTINFGAKQREFHLVITMAEMEKDEILVLREIIQDAKREIKQLRAETAKLEYEIKSISSKRWQKLSDLFTLDDLELWARDAWMPYKTELKITNGAKFMDTFVRLYGNIHSDVMGDRLSTTSMNLLFNYLANKKQLLMINVNLVPKNWQSWEGLYVCNSVKTQDISNALRYDFEVVEKLDNNPNHVKRKTVIYNRHCRHIVYYTITKK